MNFTHNLVLVFKEGNLNLCAMFSIPSRERWRIEEEVLEISYHLMRDPKSSPMKQVMTLSASGLSADAGEQRPMAFAAVLLGCK